MPAGNTASAAAEPTIPSAHARTVPSPPLTKTTSAPSATACRACPVPGSSRVVSSHPGSGQPAAASASSTSAWRPPTLSTRTGLKITTERSGPVAGSRWASPGTGSLVAVPAVVCSVMRRSCGTCARRAPAC